jgi:tetratricopeptide (TPR) repeat protein
MKKVIIVVLLLVFSTVHVAGDESTVKVLADESRVYTIDDIVKEAIIEEIFTGDLEILAEILSWEYSFNGWLEPWGFGFARKELEEFCSVDIRESGKLSYAVLKKYDVLILASFEESYSLGEVEAIKQFVENGGGLLVMGDTEYPNNSVAREFGVAFASETVYIADKKAEKYVSDAHMFYVTDIASHAITKDVDQIALNGGLPIINFESGISLIKTSKDSWADRLDSKFGSQQDDEDKGPFDILVAKEIGKGRAVFFGGAISYWNAVIFEEDHQNLQLIHNAVQWLSEPGGPYKQSEMLTEEGEDELSDGISLYESHGFPEAKAELEKAIQFFEESNEIFPNSEAANGIEEAEKYIQLCETGIKADDAFEKAGNFFEEREYEKAIEEFEKAQPLYEEIEYTERVQECTRKIEESKDWIDKREKAVDLEEKAETALEKAPSTFDFSGYQQASSAFENAKDAWEEYGNPAKVEYCQQKIEYCQDEVEKIKRTRTMVMVGIVAVIAVVAVVGVLLVRKRKKGSTETLAESKEPEEPEEPEKE